MSFGRADGSLVFETELDNDGFERGSKKLQSSVDSLCSSVNKYAGHCSGSQTPCLQASWKL